MVPRIPNEEIVILVSSLHRVAELGVPFTFTDQHAYPLMANYFTDLNDLDKVDWDLAACSFMLCPLLFVLLILEAFRNSPPYTTSVNLQMTPMGLRPWPFFDLAFYCFRSPNRF
jgi:ssDNA thymidine ADP-ribosyltransferase, DarT